MENHRIIGRVEYPMRFINVHIPKCAGTTFTAILKSNFREHFVDGRSVLSDRSFKYTTKQVDEILTQFPNCGCFSDHKLSLQLPWNKYDLKVICFVRNPVERVLSHYYYCREQSNTCFDLDAKNLLIEEYIDKVLLENPKEDVKNGQCYHLFGKTDTYDFSILTQLLASSNLLLFPVERFIEACLFLENNFPSNFKDCSFLSLNQTIRNKRDKISDQLVGKIHSLLDKDQELYKIATDYFNNLIVSQSWYSELVGMQRDFTIRCSALEKKRTSINYRFRRYLSQKLSPRSRLDYFDV